MKITRVRLHLMSAVFLVVTFLHAHAAKPDMEAQRVATAMVDRFVESWNHANGDAYGQNYWPEAELVDPSGTIVSGQPAIVQEHVEMWAGAFKGSHIVGKIRRVQRLGPLYLLVDFDAEVSGVAQGPPGSSPGGDHVLRSHLKHVMEKRHGEWKVLSAQNTFAATN